MIRCDHSVFESPGIAAQLHSPTTDLRVVNGSGVEVPYPGGLAAAKEAAAWADVVVLAVGEPLNYTSESESRHGPCGVLH